MRLEEVGSNRLLDLQLSDFRDLGLKNNFSHERVVAIAPIVIDVLNTSPS